MVAHRLVEALVGKIKVETSEHVEFGSSIQIPDSFVDFSIVNCGGNALVIGVKSKFHKRVEMFDLGNWTRRKLPEDHTRQTGAAGEDLKAEREREREQRELDWRSDVKSFNKYIYIFSENQALI